MVTYFVSRHPGAVEWLARQGLHVDECVTHLSPEQLGRDDIVIGTLPVHLVAAVQARGARYFHLSLDTPPSERGRELSPEEMDRFGARVEEYEVRRVDRSG